MKAKKAVDLQPLLLQIMVAVISGEVSKGHLKWKVSDVARQTRISRPLIYYHFGKTKKEILTKSLNLIAENLYGLQEQEPLIVPNSKKETLIKSLLRARRFYEDSPALSVFYQRSRMTSSPANAQFIEIEKRYQKKLSHQFPELDREQVSALHALFHGIITAPFLNEKSLRAAVKLISALSPATVSDE